MSRILLVLVFLLGVAACGDDDDAAIPVTGVESSDTVEDTDPDDEEVDLDDPAGADDELITAIEGLCTDRHRRRPGGDRGSALGRVCRGRRARGHGQLPPRPLDQQINEERWVREDGEWKWDNC